MIRNEKVQDIELVDGNGSIIKNTGFLTCRTEVCRSMNNSNVFFQNYKICSMGLLEQTVHYTAAKCSEN